MQCAVRHLFILQDSKAVKAEDFLIEDSMEQAVDAFLKNLSPREAGVLRMRYGLGGFERPHTLEECGFRYAVTRERIRQIETKAFSQLRRSSFGEEMLQFTLEQDEDLTRTSSAVGRKSA
jgi:RNA polymerase primary sigma factor